MLHIDVEVGEDVGDLDVRGVVDAFAAPKLERAIEGILRGGIRELVIDCHGIEFIDSGGLGAIVQAYVRAKAQGATVTLHRPNASILRLLQVTGLHRVVSIDQSVFDAESATAEHRISRTHGGAGSAAGRGS